MRPNPKPISRTSSISIRKTAGSSIQMRPDLAPKNVAQVEDLTKQGFYNGLAFHRVIAGFMAQTGDPTGTGAGGSKLPNLPAEFTTKAHFVRGTVGMARTDDPNSANSQFFICFAPAAYLDGKYTIVGEVTSGMDVVDKIKKGDGPERHGHRSGQDREDAACQRRRAREESLPRQPAKKHVKTVAKKIEKKTRRANLQQQLRQQCRRLRHRPPPHRPLPARIEPTPKGGAGLG